MQVYLAAPFFTPQQLEIVYAVEEAMKIPRVVLYSPRNDGVLSAMTPEERKQKSRAIFDLNVRNVLRSNALVAILNEKDTGTTWELGYAYKAGVPIIGFKSTEEPVNIMLQYCMSAIARNTDQLKEIFSIMRDGNFPLPYAVENSARVY